MQNLLRGILKIKQAHSSSTSALIDEEWYLKTYVDVANSGTPAGSHFMSIGWAEGRAPNPFFDTAWYLHRNNDIELSGINPLTHYTEIGWREHRNPHPLFDTRYYLEQNPDVTKSGTDPLTHYIRYGAAELRSPHPLFDAEWYCRENSVGRSDNPLAHYLETGAAGLLQPNPLFDPVWYVKRYPEAGTDPLRHYINNASRTNAQPHPLFDRAWYLANNSDVAHSGIDPLVHYLLRGHLEPRQPHPLFDTQWYLANYPQVSESGTNPLIHYLGVGEAANYAPNSVFDPIWYTQAYPTIARSRMKAFQHYILYGEFENRDPSRNFSTRFYRANTRLKPNESPLAHYLLEGKSAGLPTQPVRKFTTPLALPSGELDAQDSSPLKICVMAHVFYPDMAPEIRNWLENIPCAFDLLISTDTIAKRTDLSSAFSTLKNLKALDIQVVDNRGRDVAPLIVTFGRDILKYDVCLHIHSKKSLHSTETGGWFQFLMEHLLHSPKYVEGILDKFAKEENLGAAYPPPFPPIERHLHWAGNFDAAQSLMRDLGLTLSDSDRWNNEFPAGSMFWFRPKSIAPLLQSDLSYEDFPAEDGQTNNTLAHAIERLFLLITRQLGYSAIPIAPASEPHKLENQTVSAFYVSRYGSSENFTNTQAAILKREFTVWDNSQEAAFKADIDTAYTMSKVKYDNTQATIVMPTFNRANTLKPAIDSVIAQTHQNFQLIVVDDGSTDNTFEVLKQYLNDNRILYVHKSNDGVSAARNTGISLASGSYLFYLDSDNTWRPDYLRNMIVFMEAGNLESAYAGLRVVGDNDTLQYYRGDPFSWRECHRANYIDLNTYAHRRDAVNAPDIRFDEQLQRLVDWDFILRVSVSGPVSFAHFIGADYYNGAQGERISRTKYVNGEIKTYEAVIQSKHESLPENYTNDDVNAWNTIRAQPADERKAVKAIVRYYPDYTSNNSYQNLIYSAFDGVDLSSGTIDDCLSLLQGDDQDLVIFHLHWTAPIFAAAADQQIASARVERFIQQASKFVQLGGRIFWTVHNVLSHEGRYRDCELRLLRALCDLADTIHVHDEATQTIAAEHFTIPSEKMIVAEHGNYIGTLPDDVNTTAARERLGIPANAKVFAMLGQLRPYKGLEDLISAYEKIAAERDDCWLVLAGKPLQIDVGALKQRLSHLPNALLHAEYVSDENVQYYLRAADAVVLPYQTVLTSGSVFLAMSFGAPTIAPNIGLLGRTIEDGSNGYLYSPFSPDGLEGALRRFLCETAEKQKTLSKLARRTAELHSWNASSNKLRLRVEAPLLGETCTLQVGSQIRRLVQRLGTKPPNQASCTAIVLHYKNIEDTINCVQSLHHQGADDLAVVVLSNADTIDDALTLANRFPNITVVQNQDNIGYAAGNNIGLRICQEARCPNFWILNPDIVVPKGYYQALVNRVQKHSGHNLFGSTITFGQSPEKIWFCGGDVSLESGGFSSHHLIGKALQDAPNQAFECDYLTGANIFGRTDILTKIGYIPEDYFLYFEETDWFMQAAAHGIRPLLFPDIHLLHWKRSEESGLPTKAYCYYFVRNLYIFGGRFAPNSTVERDHKVGEFRDAWLRVIRQLAPEREKEFLDLFERAVLDGKRGVVGRVRI